ncbi:hypothetical protein [Candidatus Lokiarchaeum ossiferum]|uniref:hypothetical protein n=1 Tax=Candidatus Lokiarchaeum ossiferum TaxID=2951803 RepID=UPI00352DE5F9
MLKKNYIYVTKYTNQYSKYFTILIGILILSFLKVNIIILESKIYSNDIEHIPKSTLHLQLVNESIPHIISPGNQTFFEFDPEKTFQWSVSDPNCSYSANYSILLNFGLMDNHTNLSWFESAQIHFSAADISPGIYNLTLQVNDGWGAEANDTIILTITPNEAPTITGNRGVFIFLDEEYNGAPISLNWTIKDNHTNNSFYSIFCDSNPIPNHQNISWNSGDQIAIRTCNITENEYTYVLRAFDGYGKNSSYIVEIFWDKTGFVEEIVEEVAEEVLEEVIEELFDGDGYFPGYDVLWICLIGLSTIFLCVRIEKRKRIVK